MNHETNQEIRSEDERVTEERVASLGSLADEVEANLRKYVILPDENCYVATTLWTIHTHFMKQFDTTPRLAVISAEMGSGKSRLLEVVSAMSRNSMMSASTTPAVLFRSIDKQRDCRAGR
jgi:hypothetical protein